MESSHINNVTPVKTEFAKHIKMVMIASMHHKYKLSLKDAFYIADVAVVFRL